MCRRPPIPLSQPAVAPPPDAIDELAHRQATRYVWALLLARIYEMLPLLCPRSGGAMRIIAFITEGPPLSPRGRLYHRGAAFITEGPVIRAIRGHLGEPKQPPRLRPARGPPLWAMPDRGADAINPQAQRMPDHEFGKRVAWQGTRPQGSRAGDDSCL